MGEVALAHQVVGVEGFLDVGVVNTDRHTHQHVLRAFSHFTVELEQVGALQGLESEVIVVVVSTVVDVVVEHIGVGHDDLVHLFGDERSVLVGLGVNVLTKVGDDIGEGVLGGAVEVVHADTGSKATVVRVMRSQGGGRFSSELVELSGGDTIVEALDGQLGNVAGVNPCRVKTFGEFDEFFVNRIKAYIFSLAFPVDNLHSHDSFLLVCSNECVISFFVRVRFKSLRPQRNAVVRFREKRCP